MPTYAGCGKHIEQVLGNIPPADRCHCREQARSSGTIGERSLLKRLFGL
jgi:hypothetical protein